MLKRAGLLLVSLVVGYGTMVILITLVQEGLFGGVSYSSTPLPQLAVAGLLTVGSAVVGGAVAARIFGPPWFPPAGLMCGLVTLETSYLIKTGVLTDPLWFDVSAGISLVVGILVGAYVTRKWQDRVPATAP